MSSQIDELKKTVERLSDEGRELHTLHFVECKIALNEFLAPYQFWYTESAKLVDVLLPDRSEEFRGYYEQSKRKEITYLNYTLQDYLIGLVVKSHGSPLFDTTQSASVKFAQQIYIVRSINRRQKSIMSNLRSFLQADLFDSELAVARELHKNGHTRAAGAVSGVVLERHLHTVCANHRIQIRKKAPGISDYNQILKDSDILDIPNWRFIQRLADIRNLCAHPKERDPTADEVLDLINGTEKVIKSVF